MSVPGARSVPNTAACIPGAKTVANDALFATPVICVVLTGPTTNVTGTTMYCGVTPVDWMETAAEYTPTERPAPVAVMVNSAAPVPGACERVSQFVVVLLGVTAADHWGDALPKPRARLAEALCCGSPTCIVTLAGETVNAAGAGGAATSGGAAAGEA